MRRPLCALCASAVLAVPALARAATTFAAFAPAHRSSSADPRPTIAVEVVDPADGIDPATLVLRVAGEDVTLDATLSPIADGFGVDYRPPAPFAFGRLVPVEVEVRTLTGRLESTFWSFHVDLRYDVGTLVIDMSSEVEDAIFGGYGLALRLASLGHQVHWVIDRGKGYEDRDFRATTDDAPLPETPEADGSVRDRDYGGGPFVIPDPDPSTPGNDAWPAIAALTADYGYAPRVHEIRDPLQVEFTDAVFLTYMPRVAVSDTGDAVTELDLARLPYYLVAAPGTTDDDGSVGGGALFRDLADPLCGGRRHYDVYNQSHQDWKDDDPEHLAAVGELDDFLAKQGMAIFQCRSASIENITHWITEPPDDIVEGSTGLAPAYVPDPGHTDHPFLQTIGTIPVPGGSFALWDETLNEFRPNLRYLLTEIETDDIGYVFGAVGSGKAYYMGGHGRDGLSDQRLVLNALLYNAVYPKFERRFSPQHVRAGEDNPITVEIRASGGSESTATILEDRLDPFSSLVPGSVNLAVPGASHGYDPATRVLTVDLGDLNPRDFPDGLLGSYQVTVHPPDEGRYAILDHTSTHVDQWGASYRLDTVGCTAVRAEPELRFEKTASALRVVAGATTRLTLRLRIVNDRDSVPLYGVTVTDTLPPAVTFVPGSITATRGAADWNVSAIDTLTWRTGTVLPGDTAVLTFEVDVSPAVPTQLLLNDGARLRAADPWGDPVDLTSNHLLARAIDADALLTYDLTPPAVAGGGPATLDLCATNPAAPADFVAPSDVIELSLPAPLGEPTGIVAPPGWEWSWDPRARLLSWRRLEANQRLDTGTAVCFAFDLLLPSEPAAYPIEAYGTLDGLASFGQLSVAVPAAAGLALDPPGVYGGEPCQPLVHGFTVDNTGSGGDVIAVTAQSSLGSTLTIHADDDGDGQLDPGEAPLGDSDGDGDGDTGPVAAGGSASLLAVIEVAGTAEPTTDEVTVTARSALDPALESSLIVQLDVAGFRADIAPDEPQVCAGGSVTLDAGPGHASYAWSTGEDTRTIEAYPSQDGDSWSVTVGNAFGCEAVATETIAVVEALPMITSDREEVCVGGAATLDAGPGFASYLWSTAETTRTIRVEPESTTVYAVTVATAFGCSGVDDIAITVRAPPAAAAGPDLTICPGQAAVLGAPAIPGYGYAWTPIEGLDDPTAARPTAQPAITTTYTVEVTDPAGCTATAEATLTIDPTPEQGDIGNLLRLSRVAADIDHRWQEPPGIGQLTLAVATRKQRDDDEVVAVIPAGVGRHREIGAIERPGDRAFYQLGVTICNAPSAP